MRMHLFHILLAITSISCEEQFGICNDEIPSETVENAVEMFQGRVVQQSSAIMEGIGVWKVKIENNSGAIVTFYWQKNYNILFQIDAENGPYDYNLKPPVDAISLSTAKFIAVESYSSLELDSWKLIRDKTHNQEWVYQFFLKGKENPISVKAATGDLM